MACWTVQNSFEKGHILDCLVFEILQSSQFVSDFPSNYFSANNFLPIHLARLSHDMLCRSLSIYFWLIVVMIIMIVQ